MRNTSVVEFRVYLQSYTYYTALIVVSADAQRKCKARGRDMSTMPR